MAGENKEQSFELGGDDLFSLLESVQEQQNQADLNRIKTKEKESTAVEQEKGGPAQAGLSSEDAFAAAMNDEDISRVIAESAAPAFQNKPFEEYDKTLYAWSQLDEIKKGIDHNVDVSFYDDPALLFRQMREIRLGLEQGVDVSTYANRYYKDSQMREIRLGLMEGYDTSSYTRLIYSLPDMKRKHNELVLRAYKKSSKKTDFFYTDRDTELSIFTDEGRMRAFIRCNKELPEGFSKANLDSMLYLYGVTDGLMIDDMDMTSLTIGEDYLVATGEPSLIGEDGYFEYFVSNLGNNKPKINEDGSIDYRSQRAYASVRAGDRIALYHPATSGKIGHTVTGMELPSYSGKNKKRLTTDARIRLEDDGVTYTALADGFVTVQEGKIKVLDLLEFNEDIGYANGNILFDGSIHIRGNVQESAIIEAAGDIVIDGFVESATVKAGGDITIAKGVNGNEKGRLEAGGGVVASFLENARVVAGTSVEAGYILNSRIICAGIVRTVGGRSRIVGGQIRAGAAIESGDIGNDSHVRTELEVGKPSDFDERSKDILIRRKRLQEEMDKVRAGMNGVLEKVGAIKGRTNEIYLKLQDVMEKQMADMAGLDKEAADLEDELAELQKVYIHAMRTAYENTRLVINGKAAVLREDVRGSKFQNIGGMIQSSK